MQTVRRIYVYLMSAIGLGVLLVGLDVLLTAAFHAAGIGRNDRLGSSEATGTELSLAAALIVVGLLVWAVHWLLAERSVRSSNPKHQEERAAAERAVYLTVVLSVLLIFGVMDGIGLLERATTRLFGLRSPGSFDFSTDSGNRLATVVVTGAAWAYHVAIRQRDLRAGELTGAAAWLPRVYLYGATLIGLIFTMFNAGSLLGAGLEAATGRVTDVDPAASPERRTAIAIAGIIGWGIVWLGHWWYATRLAHGTGWRAESERGARLRVAFFVAAIGSMALAASIFAFLALSGVLRLALGALTPDASEDPVQAIVVPFVSMLPWVGAWWLHRNWLLSEARAAGDPARLATAERLNAAVVAFIGLGALGGGGAGLLGLGIDALFGGDRTIGVLGKTELANYLAVAAVGLTLWPWNWLRLQARLAAAPEDEAGSTVRRAYLLIALAVAVIGCLGSLAFVLYRLFNALFGVVSGLDMGSDLSGALGVLIVAAAAAVYHGMALRRDQALRAESQPVEPAGEVAAEAQAAPAVPSARRVLVLSGPADADLDATVTALRAALSPGLSLESGPPED